MKRVDYMEDNIIPETKVNLKKYSLRSKLYDVLGISYVSRNVINYV